MKERKMQTQLLTTTIDSDGVQGAAEMRLLFHGGEANGKGIRKSGLYGSV